MISRISLFFLYLCLSIIYAITPQFLNNFPDLKVAFMSIRIELALNTPGNIYAAVINTAFSDDNITYYQGFKTIEDFFLSNQNNYTIAKANDTAVVIIRGLQKNTNYMLYYVGVNNDEIPQSTEVFGQKFSTLHNNILTFYIVMFLLFIIIYMIL